MAKYKAGPDGTPRFGTCKGCGETVAQDSQRRWITGARLGAARQNNPDGSANIDGQPCNDTADGKHKPEAGSLW